MENTKRITSIKTRKVGADAMSGDELASIA